MLKRSNANGLLSNNEFIVKKNMSKNNSFSQFCAIQTVKFEGMDSMKKEQR